MCGIFGLWNKVPQADFKAKIDIAIKSLALRGPDDQGVSFGRLRDGELALGHTRLSIIDLSQAGHQPMKNRGGNQVIVFNGEIYNYKELKAELVGLGASFDSDSDTEVLLSAWVTWGAACLPRLQGMFAFAVFNFEKQTLTCVRDPFGIKPLFYRQTSESFCFASELPALLALSPEKPMLNWQRAYDYLVFGDYDSSADSFVDGAKQLLPGHIMSLDLITGQQTEHRAWWQPTFVQGSALSFKDAAESLREQFLENVRLHLHSDVPIGAALSGGIDSSAVVCCMRHLEPDLPINTFSYIAHGTEVGEEHWVDLVNQHVKATSHKVTLGPEDLAADLDDMIRAQGEPFGSTSIYAQYRVFKLAKHNGITVTLDGQGADEMLAGYNGYPGHRIRSLLDEGRYLDAWEFLGAWAKWPGRNRLEGAKRLVNQLTKGTRLQSALMHVNGTSARPKWLNSDLLGAAGVRLSLPYEEMTEIPGRRVMAELAASLTQRGLMGLLRHGDRNSMRFSVESRVPFLTPSLADFLLSLPESYLISSQGETKHIFRSAMRGIVPDAVLDRRDKIGFATPESEWLHKMSATVRQWLSDDLGIPFLNQREILKEFDRIVAGKQSFTWQVWRWVNFIRWYRMFCMS
jgi:asparagine synthase (glutamine-hydrolysing)